MVDPAESISKWLFGERRATRTRTTAFGFEGRGEAFNFHVPTEFDREKADGIII